MEKYRPDSPMSYALGMSLTIEALKKRPQVITKILLSSRCHKNHQFSEMEELAKAHRIPMETDDAAIASLSLKENCYAVTLFKKFTSMADKKGDHIALVDFKEFGDLGTILRSSVSFDYHDIILIGQHPDIFDPRCIRASMGAIFHLNFSEYPDLSSYRKAHLEHHLYPFTSQGEAFENAALKRPYTFLFSEKYDGLDGLFSDGYSLPHEHFEDIPLSSLSSIVLAEGYHRKRSR